MKKIIFTLAVLLTAMGFQSCSLHDDTDLFGKPAAERIEETIQADKQLLESATNGWLLHYYTGEEYSGGGFTVLCKFKDGKAEVSADFANSVSDVSHSSYDVIKDRGPVLTFDTYNEIMHMMAQPSQSNIDGEQGDYEFVIQKTTNDSIYLEGKKWHNKMVMTRMDENTSWTSYLEGIKKVEEHLLYNNKLLDNNDSLAYVIIDNEQRRIAVNVDEKTDEVPYYVTPQGIHLHTPIQLANGKCLSDLSLDASGISLSETTTSGLSLERFFPANYKPIEFWTGDWNLVCASPNADGQPTETYVGYPLTMEVRNASNVRATITLNGLKYVMNFAYDRGNGTLEWYASYIVDPSNTYFGLLMMPVNLKEGGYLNQMGSLIAKWNEANDRAYFTWDGNGSPEVDSYAFLAINSSYSPVIKDNGYVMVAQVPYIQGLQRVSDAK